MKAVALTPPIMRVTGHDIARARGCEYAQGSCMRAACADETAQAWQGLPVAYKVLPPAPLAVLSFGSIHTIAERVCCEWPRLTFA